MALKVKLKPNERIIVAGASITNGGSAATLIIGNRVPVLRERDILKQEEADSPAKRIYFVVQVMYVDPNGMAGPSQDLLATDLRLPQGRAERPSPD